MSTWKANDGSEIYFESFGGRDKAKPIRFGPYLAVAGLIALLWGDVIVSTYLSLGASGS